MHRIQNQTAQPQELSDGKIIAANENIPVKTIGKRERDLQMRGIIFIREVAPEKDVSKAKTKSSVAEPEGEQNPGNSKGDNK